MRTHHIRYGMGHRQERKDLVTGGLKQAVRYYKAVGVLDKAENGMLLHGNVTTRSTSRRNLELRRIDGTGSEVLTDRSDSLRDAHPRLGRPGGLDDGCHIGFVPDFQDFGKASDLVGLEKENSAVSG